MFIFFQKIKMKRDWENQKVFFVVVFGWCLLFFLKYHMLFLKFSMGYQLSLKQNVWQMSHPGVSRSPLLHVKTSYSIVLFNFLQRLLLNHQLATESFSPACMNFSLYVHPLGNS